MAIKINELIEYFATSTIEFKNAFKSTLPVGKIDTNRKTAFQLCGLIIPLRGTARFSLNGVPYHIDVNTIVHAGEGMDIKIKTYEEDWTYVVVHYQVIQAKDELKSFVNQHFSIEIDNMHEVQEILNQLLTKNMNPDYFSQFELKVIFMNLLQSILNGARNSQYNLTLQQVTQILDYFHTHYEEEIVISEVADMFDIDRRRIAYLFEKITGLTPIRYLTRYRISKAKELLTASELSIAEISEAIGYQDSFYFSRVFKDLTQMSPSQFRKVHQS
ncbi:helix-turn-helix domain-containing protein [Bacillus massiliigorillae]|uniref:helix-turn-helix domain-containing protein n=1 Tax=Bacillus massiliigorillae TaxID=1243664 RepID=UPI00039FB1A3|nr:AraC family transcriptional regulator [Bacillus massiliigorillae]